MTSGQQGKSQVPRPVAGVNLRSLPIGPTEAFVLSRVDGKASEGDIALSTGLPRSDVTVALLRLADLGAVQLPGDGEAAPPRSGVTSSAPAGAPSGTHPTAPAVVIRAAPPEPEAAAPYPPEELDHEADLDRERKHVILSTYYQLQRYTHYELLGVPQGADKKAIKSAYYQKVATFHPDKYFGKALGPFKPKLETIFVRVTEAHDTLTRKHSRAEYDQYLESQRATRGLDDAETARALEVLRREMEQEARLAEGVEGTSQRPGAPPEQPGAVADSAPRHTPVPSSAPRLTPMTPEERRRALARKLGGASLPPPAAKAEPSSPPQAGPTPRALADDALRRRYEARLKEVRSERLQRYLAQADEALKARKPVAAANALRIAASLAPDDPVLAARFQKVEGEAAAALADQYQEQGRYDERRGHFLEAAQAYERALRGRPGASLFERAAHCLLEGRGDPRKATEHARRAVELSPETVAYRIVLARAYARAGLEQSALGELERARALAPTDDTIKDWIKRVKRGEV